MCHILLRTQPGECGGWGRYIWVYPYIHIHIHLSHILVGERELWRLPAPLKSLSFPFLLSISPSLAVKRMIFLPQKPQFLFVCFVFVDFLFCFVSSCCHVLLCRLEFLQEESLWRWALEWDRMSHCRPVIPMPKHRATHAHIVFCISVI